MINTNASPSEIAGWKKKSEVATSYEELFKRMHKGEGPTVLTYIAQKVLKEDYTNNEV